MMKLAGVILAGGLGIRMNSSIPKVLHDIQGNPMLYYALSTLRELSPRKIIIVAGKHLKEIKEAVGFSSAITFAQQKEAKGTADALLTALPFIRGFKGTVLVVNGDAPMITRKTLKKFLALHEKKGNKISILTFTTSAPESYGRIIKDENGNIISIVEEKDATPSQKMINEVNSGVYAFESDALNLLKEIKLNKAKGEYYLTDIAGVAGEKGFKTTAFSVGSEDELRGVNTPEELDRVRQLTRDRVIARLEDRGVSFVNKNSVFISFNTFIGSGTKVYPNVYTEGHTKIGKGCTIYPNVRIRDGVIGDGAIIKDSTLIEESVVKRGASIGPFAHLRPGSEIGEEARIGNFVEVKKSVIGSSTKASHLTYLGDAKIGKNVNIGAGTITCNYDGYHKHITEIEDKVFIGSDSQLIAPVRIGKGAFVGAGSTITKDVPPLSLALSRVEQQNIKGWAIKRQLKVKGKKKK